MASRCFSDRRRVSEHVLTRKHGEIRAGGRRRGRRSGSRRSRGARWSGHLVAQAHLPSAPGSALGRPLPCAPRERPPGRAGAAFSTSWVPTTQRSCAPQPGARGSQGTERPQALSQSPIKPASFLQTHKSALRGEVLYCLLFFSRQEGCL